MRRRLGSIAAWVITCALLLYVFRQVNLREVLAALRGAAPWTVPAAAILVLAIYAADSFAMWKTFGWFVAQLRLTEVLLVRGATYLLALINYAVGQGAIVYFVRRSRGIPVVRSSATILLIMGINVLALLAFASAGLATAGAIDGIVTKLVLAGYIGFVVYLLVIRLRPGPLVRQSMLQVLFQAGVGGHLKAFLVRLPHIASLILFHWTVLRGFGVALPLSHAVVYLPIIFLAALIPSFLGLGPTQAVMVELIAKYAPGDSKSTVLAASLTAWTIAVVVQVAISLICLRSQLTRGLSADASAASS